MLECATVVGALTAHFLAGLLSTRLLELLFPLAMCGRPFIDPQARLSSLLSESRFALFFLKQHSIALASFIAYVLAGLLTGILAGRIGRAV